MPSELHRRVREHYRALKQAGLPLSSPPNLSGGYGTQPSWTLWQKLRSVVGASVRFVSDGCRFSTAELVSHRKSICELCPNWTNQRCRICGCSGIKWDFPAEQCPDDPPRWLPVTRETHETTWSVAIPTVPRKTVTLENTIRGLKRAGWLNVTVFAEPDSPQPADREGVEWRQNSERMGPLPNWQQCMTWALSMGAELILIVEDDLAICSGLRSFVESFAPRDGVVSLIRSERFEAGVGPWDKMDWSRYEWFWLAQATVWPRAIAQRFVKSEIFQNQWPGPNQGDIAIGMWCKDSGVPLYLPTPSYVQHVGTSHFGSWSSAWDHAQNGWGTSASDFIGDDVDVNQVIS